MPARTGGHEVGVRVEVGGPAAARAAWSHHGVLGRLNREWAALQDDPDAQEACRRWAGTATGLRGVCRPADVLDRVAAAPDAVLGHLLGEVAAGDALAGRVVLQALLPKAVRMASLDATAGVDEYVTALWCEIVSYRLDRRPSSIAGNLVLDTLKSVRRERRSGLDVATAPDVVLAAADGCPTDVVGLHDPPDATTAVEVIARAREHRLVDGPTGALLRSVYAEGLSGERAARQHGLSPGAVRVRCSRAVKVLAGHSALLASAG